MFEQYDEDITYGASKRMKVHGTNDNKPTVYCTHVFKVKKTNGVYKNITRIYIRIYLNSRRPTTGDRAYYGLWESVTEQCSNNNNNNIIIIVVVVVVGRVYYNRIIVGCNLCVIR